MEIWHKITNFIDQHRKVFNTVSLVLATLFFIVLGIFASYLSSVREEVKNLKNSNYALTNTVNQLSSQVSDLQTRLESYEAGSSNTDNGQNNPLESIHTEQTVYRYEDSDAKTAFEEMADDIYFPIVFPSGSVLKGDIIYTITYPGTDNVPENYSLSKLSASLTKDGIGISLTHGFYGTGGGCVDQFTVQSNLGELSVCVNEEISTINYTHEDTNSATGSDIIYSFELTGTYEKSTIESLFASLETID